MGKGYGRAFRDYWDLGDAKISGDAIVGAETGTWGNGCAGLLAYYCIYCGLEE